MGFASRLLKEGLQVTLADMVEIVLWFFEKVDEAAL